MALLLESKGKLKESRDGGKHRGITAIEAGWGSSGYYGMPVLERDIPTIFPTGSPMYLDHPTLTEEIERPERSMRDLVGRTCEAFSPVGKGMDSVAYIYEHWVPFINEVAPDTGLSIRAFGIAEAGTEEGKSGEIVSQLTEGLSIDYVTEPGAGGKAHSLLESGRAKQLLESARAVGSPHVSREALQSTLYSNLETAGEALFNKDERFDSYVYVDDFDVDGNWVIYSVRQGDAERILVKVPFTRTGSGVITLSDTAEKVNRATTYEVLGDIPLDESRSGGGNNGPEKEDQMSDEDKQRLSELAESVKTLKEENETLKGELKEAKQGQERAEEALLLNEAGKVVRKIVSEAENLPKGAKTRIIERALSKDLPVDSQGKLIESELKERANKALTEEQEYLSEATGQGRVRGAGGGEQFRESRNGGGGDEPDEDEIKALSEAFERRGMSKEAARKAAEGR